MRTENTLEIILLINESPGLEAGKSKDKVSEGRWIDILLLFIQSYYISYLLLINHYVHTNKKSNTGIYVPDD